jgi:multiple sugar transport system permease protein
MGLAVRPADDLEVSMPKHPPARSLSREETVIGYLLSGPSILALFLFMVLPILASIALVFTNYDLLTPPEWAGADNITRLIGDKRLWTCFRNSALITVGAVALNNTLGLLLAVGVNRQMPRVFKYLFRTALFFPVLCTTSSLAMVWRFLLAQDRGIVNWILVQIGLQPAPFLTSTSWAIRSVILYDVWKSCGYLMVLYLAGLQGIPDSLYEAARIDGASGLQLFRHVTLPLITPTAFFALIISSIGAFQIFDNSYVLTTGGPGDASRTIAMYIYEMAFKRYEMGYASAVSMTLLIILLGLTLIQFLGSRRWVHYD